MREQVPELNLSNYDHDDVCNLNRWACEADATIADLAAKLKRAVEVVRKCEWEEHDNRPRECDPCPACKRTRRQGHASTCPLAAVLKENA